jgi:hypothetical protein
MREVVLDAILENNKTVYCYKRESASQVDELRRKFETMVFQIKEELALSTGYHFTVSKADRFYVLINNTKIYFLTEKQTQMTGFKYGTKVSRWL